MDSNKSFLFYLVVGMLTGCSGPQKQNETTFDVEAYKKEIAGWQQQRNAYQVSENGWVNLAGLFWLKEGINSFGSAKSNDLVFPQGKIPEQAGYFVVQGNTVTVNGNNGVIFTRNGKESNGGILFHPDSAQITMAYGPLRWFVIKREAKLGIRLRDLEHPLLKEFKGIEFYPVDPAWRLEGTVEWADSSRTIEITNVLGQTLQQRSVGTLVFDYAGATYRLDALDEGNNEFFIIFGDETNARETYGAGRYLYVPLPDSTGRVVIDFNRAYNPPCAFTEFATCPLPPKQNILPFPVKAGEKNYGDH
ncbi:MAG: DUF1684 domain-containing protein [Flammeovirgaceae bacterium]|nr:MAG: DUF1684 domain-containing protein [Flammeovirgaceae bacterium]